jgi:hypothetical protein
MFVDAVEDHLSRAEYFLAAARRSNNSRDFSWLILAAVYSSRAAIEVLEYDAEFSGDQEKAKAIELAASKAIRHFDIIRHLRVHDFHRHAVSFTPNLQQVFGGFSMISGNSPKAAVEVNLSPGGTMEVKTEKSGRLKYFRSGSAPALVIRGLEVKDEAKDAFVRVDIAVEEYLHDLRLYAKKPRSGAGSASS